MNLDLEVPLDSYKRDSDYPPTAIVQLGQKFGASVLFLLKDFLKEPMLISYTFFFVLKDSLKGMKIPLDGSECKVLQGFKLRRTCCGYSMLFHVIAAILCVGILNSPVLAFTQEYPPAFGRAIYDWWKARKHQLRIEGYLLLVAIVIAF